METHTCYHTGSSVWMQFGRLVPDLSVNTSKLQMLVSELANPLKNQSKAEADEKDI